MPKALAQKAKNPTNKLGVETYNNLAASIRKDIDLPSHVHTTPTAPRNNEGATSALTEEPEIKLQKRPKSLIKKNHTQTADIPTLTQSPILAIDTPPQKHVIALLLPLTGKYDYIGKHLLNSAEMAIFEQGNPDLILKPFDTKASEEGAINAYQQAKEHHPTLILGPVFSATTWAIIRKETPAIPLISFSNDSSLTNRGIYLFGFDPTQHIRRILEYATAQNITQYISITPDNSYGILATRELSSFLHDSNLPTATMEWYANASAELSKSIVRIAKSTHTKPQKSVGLLIPEGGKALNSIISRLKNGKNRFDQFRLLGSGEWDSQSTVNNKQLSGAWFATTPPKKRRIFRETFEKTYGYTPIRIGSLAYDAIFLANAYIKQTEENEVPITLDKLADLEGLNGRFYFSPNGQTERNLSIIEITDYGYNVIDE